MPGLTSSFVVFFICSISVFFNRAKYKAVCTLLFHFKYIIVVYFILLVMTLQLILFSVDTSFAFSMLKAIVILFATILYIGCYYDAKTVTRLMNLFFMNALICFIVGSMPELKFLISPFQYGSGELIGGNTYRNSFLAGSGYFGVASAFAFAFCFFEYILIHKEIKFKLVYLIKFISILLAAILAGRIAIPIVFFSFIYFFIEKRKLSYLFYVTLLLVIVYYILQIEALYAVNWWIQDMFSFDKSIKENSSANHLLTMVSIPDNDWTFFIGDGVFQDSGGGYYMNTDIGYLRHWYFGGILFMIIPLLIFPLLYLRNRSTFFIVFLFPIALILHFKGLFILNNPMFMPFLFIISYYFYKEECKTN